MNLSTPRAQGGSRWLSDISCQVNLGRCHRGRRPRERVPRIPGEPRPPHEPRLLSIYHWPLCFRSLRVLKPRKPAWMRVAAACSACWRFRTRKPRTPAWIFAADLSSSVKLPAAAGCCSSSSCEPTREETPVSKIAHRWSAAISGLSR